MKNLKKLNLAKLPTPITYLKGLSEEWGTSIYVKRDDLSGMELAGNKIRKLEYSLAEAQDLGCDVVITAGAIQSNHCRATSFACSLLGLECHVVLTGDNPGLDGYEGNTFLDLMAGAYIHFLSNGSDRMAAMEKLKEHLTEQGHKPYIIPVGASNAVGTLGYMACFREILQQEKVLGLNFDAIVLAVGSGGTYAGLWYENQRLEAGKDVFGICVADDVATFTQDIDKIVADLKAHFACPDDINRHVYHLNDKYIGKGYAQTTPPEVHFLVDIAQKTGIVFDPCYTGKAFRGMSEEIKHGDLKDKRNILFIHTGGIFGWTAESRQMAMDVLQEQVSSGVN